MHYIRLVVLGDSRVGKLNVVSPIVVDQYCAIACAYLAGFDILCADP